jgi:hypothetical protein
MNPPNPILDKTMLENSSTDIASYARGCGHPTRSLRVKSRPLRPPSHNGSTSALSVGRQGRQWAKRGKGKPSVGKQNPTVAKAPDLGIATTGGAATSAMGGGVNAGGRMAGMRQLPNPGPTTRNTVEVTPREYQQVRSLATQCNEQEEANTTKMETLGMTAMVMKDTRFAKADHCSHERRRGEKEEK